MLNSLAVSLAPRQLGYGSPLGSEAAVHAARSYLESVSSPSDKLMLKMDFRNAFNSLRRDKMLQSVSVMSPMFFSVCAISLRDAVLSVLWRSYSPVSRRCAAGLSNGFPAVLSLHPCSSVKA